MSVGDWIPVTERLPDDEIEVLISTMHESFPGWIGYVSHEHDETRWHWDSGQRSSVRFDRQRAFKRPH